jgi:hypothetical protein
MVRIAIQRLFVTVFVSLSVAMNPAAQDRPASPFPTELLGYIERFTGPAPLDCGQLPVVSRDSGLAEKAVDCGRRAAELKRPFSIVQWRPMMDSLVLSGLVGDSLGRIYLFSYDSAPCGGPNCAARFSIESCATPTVGGPPDFALVCKRASQP